MRAIFEDRFLSGQVAMRGGTVLHKVHLAPAARYSEDIDLVAVGDRPEGHIRKALLRVLRPVLGRERSSVWDSVQLAVRNAAKPSRILRCIYKLPSVAEPGRELTIEVEANVTERTPHFPVQRLPFPIQFRGANLGTEIVSYNINEMLATKMRALFQRNKGRDLFDLYWALSVRSALPVPVAEILQASTTTCRRKASRWRGRSSSHTCVSALPTGLGSAPTLSRSCGAISSTIPTSPAPSSSGTFSAYCLCNSTLPSSWTESWP
jgi:predicted nucleotidyltransferase component of viral defense system